MHLGCECCWSWAGTQVWISFFSFIVKFVLCIPSEYLSSFVSAAWLLRTRRRRWLRPRWTQQKGGDFGRFFLFFSVSLFKFTFSFVFLRYLCCNSFRKAPWNTWPFVPKMKQPTERASGRRTHILLFSCVLSIVHVFNCIYSFTCLSSSSSASVCAVFPFLVSAPVLVLCALSVFSLQCKPKSLVGWSPRWNCNGQH